MDTFASHEIMLRRLVCRETTDALSLPYSGEFCDFLRAAVRSFSRRQAAAFIGEKPVTMLSRRSGGRAASERRSIIRFP
ncbi:hypothetical protein C5748_04660 [Phyllobacterium phragmitis]|uniref:Uncharacterized protein n=1 Tax=Phyllobacterium phragmitis TaxID=2670329 RepID=A0A2S9IVY8_9HYPH|nr:hypothetical protein C5748_04660 [Phyllobacterium phragmitis]